MHSSGPCVAQSYVKELGQCLLQLETRADEQVTQRLTQLTNECQDHLNGTYQGLHPALAKAIAGGNLEQALATVAQLDHTFWSSILVSQSVFPLCSCFPVILLSSLHVCDTCLPPESCVCLDCVNLLAVHLLKLCWGYTVHVQPSVQEFEFSAVQKFDFLQDVWQLSQPQVADIVYMRRLVLTRRAVLAEERSAILSQLAVTNAQMQNNKMEDVTVLRLTEALLKVSAEHRQALAIQTQAWGHGVSPLRNICRCSCAYRPRPGNMGQAPHVTLVTILVHTDTGLVAGSVAHVRIVTILIHD